MFVLLVSEFVVVKLKRLGFSRSDEDQGDPLLNLCLKVSLPAFF